CRHPVGTYGRLPCETGQSAYARHAVDEGLWWAAACLSHRHGGSRDGPELEAAAQPPAYREPRRHKPAAARIRSASGRRKRPAHHRRTGEMRTSGAIWALIVGLGAFACTGTRGEDAPPEPAGYRTDNYRAPTPATLAGARVI